MNGFKKILIVALVASFAACSAKPAFKVSSTAVKGNPETGYFSKLKSAGRVDGVYTAKDTEALNTRSIPLKWENLPAGTKVLALILDDPDAKPVMESFGIKGDAFLHWTAADIDPSTGGLADNASAVKGKFVQGANMGGSTGYVGPKPPSNIPSSAKKPLIHIYRLKVYALSSATGLKEGFARKDLEAAMKGKILGEAELLFSYNN